MKKNITESQLKLIIEDRLNLQSIKRTLEIYHLPKNNLNYFTSADFIQNYFNKWDETKRQGFLKTVGGVEWKKLKHILDKTNS